MTVLVIAEHDNATLKPSTFHVVSAAIQCGGDIHVLVAGHDCKGVSQAAARIEGVSKVLLSDAPQFAHGLAENMAEQVFDLALAGGYTHLLAPASAYGKSILPRVAAKLDIAQISEITKVVAHDVFERPIYAGNAIATVQASGKLIALTIRSVSFKRAGEGGSAPVECVALSADVAKSSFLTRSLSASERPDLTSARVVVAGGRGMGSSDNFRLLAPLADKLGAAMGASRAAVDAGFVPNDLQIGQTGKIVAPELYIAVGISGAIQHLAGISDSKIIVAINKDPEAPIFSVADYGIVGDLFEVIPDLILQLEQLHKKEEMNSA